MWPDGCESLAVCRVTPQYATLVPQLPRFPHANQDVRHGDPTSFLQVVVIVREQTRYRHLRYCGWDQELSLKERAEVYDDHCRVSYHHSTSERELPQDPGGSYWTADETGERDLVQPQPKKQLIGQDIQPPTVLPAHGRGVRP
jgi:hypothetical protein